jgi:prolyl oligopeptidase
MLVLAPKGRAFLTVAHGSARERSVFLAAGVMDTEPPLIEWRCLAMPRERVHTWALRGDEWCSGHARDEGWVVRASDLSSSGLGRRELCSGRGSALEDLVAVTDYLVLRTLVDGAGSLLVLGPGDEATGPLPVSLPERAGIAGVTPANDTEGPACDILLTGWVSPSQVHRVNLRSLARHPRWPTPPPGLGQDATCTLDWATASDGERVPVTVIAPPGTRGPVPTWLVSYGFFGITLRPVFTPMFLAWVRRGGAVAIAHVRGGGDRGEAWYRAGHRDRTERTVQDHLDVADHLVRRGLTSPDCLISEGTSAGGLTVGGAMARAPEKFGAVVMRVSLTHSLRLEMHENGPPNIPEYGTIATPDGVRALLACDVYTRIEPGRPYPPVLLTVGLRDPRVLPWQPGKLAARLQERSPSLVLLRVEEHGGHGVGAATSQTVTEAADRLCFALFAIGGARDDVG